MLKQFAPIAGYGIYRLLAAGPAVTDRRRLVAAGVAAYSSLNISALLTAVQLGLQPLIASGVDGKPLYAPFPLELAVPAIALEHLLLFGFVEAAVTVLVLRYIMKNEPEMVRS